MIETNHKNGFDLDSRFIRNRHRTSKRWHGIFFASTAIGIIALVILLASIINQSMGLVAVVNKVTPESISAVPFEQLTNDELINILRTNLPASRLRTIEKEKPLSTREQSELIELVNVKIIDPKVVASWNLWQSLFEKDRIAAIIQTSYPNAQMSFRSWINWKFITQSLSNRPELAGIRIALKGSIFIVLIAIAFAFPVGIASAIYLEEYAHPSKWLNRIIQANIDNLVGVPSIIYGILGLAVFVRSLAPLTSGQIFGVNGATSRSILSGGLTLGLLILPMFILNAQEAIRAVPTSLRLASYGLGATKWQTVRSHVLPSALSGILTGSILAISRAIGETAPLIVVGASTFITSDPSNPFSGFTALPILIYNWTTRPQDQFRNIASAAIIVLLISLLSLNALAIFLRNHYNQRRV